MALVLPVKGQEDWDVTLNAALQELESEIVANSSQLNGVTVTNAPTANQSLVATSTTQASWQNAFDTLGSATTAQSNAEAYTDTKIATEITRTNATYVAKDTLFINVKDHGAVGDGTTDDTTAINSAITLLKSNGSGILYFPNGTFVTTGLLINSFSRFSIVGERGSVLALAAGSTSNILTIADCTDFTVEGMSLDGRRDSLFPITPLAANATSGQPSIQVAHGASSAYTVGQRLNLNAGLTVNSGSEANRQDQQLVIQTIVPGSGASNDTITFTTNLANSYSFAAGTLSDGYGPYAANGAYVTPWQTGNAVVAGRTLTEEDQQNGIHLINCQRFNIQKNNIHNVWESPIRMGTHILNGSAQNDGCSYGTIADNILWHGYDQGIGIWCSSNITATGNVITSAGWSGISMTLSDDCTVTGNVSSNNVQRIPNDVKAGYGLSIEGGARNTVSGNKCSNNYGNGIYLTAGGTIPFGGPAQVATSISSASNAVALPAGTVNVGSTTNFASAGQFTVLSSAGAQQITYTGKTGTSFTGCTGGIGTLYTNQRVTQYPVFLNNGAALQIGSTTTVVSDGTKFQVGGKYSIVDGPRTEQVVVQSIATNTLTFTKPTQFRHVDNCQFSQSVCEDNVILGNSFSGGNDVGIRVSSGVRTTISNNIINRAGLGGIDLVSWTFGGLQPPVGTVISGNTITSPDTSNDGSSYEAIVATQCSDLQIINNRCNGAPSTQGYFSAMFVSAVTDSVISGNIISDAYAIGLQLSAVNEWVCKRVQVSNNEILRCFGEGMILFGGNELTVKNNIITNCAANNGPGGFGGALDIRGVINSQISDNIVMNNGHGGIGLDSASINGNTVNCVGNILSGNISGDDGQNYDPFTGAHTQQGSGIKELSAGQGPNTYVNNKTFGNITDFSLTSTGNPVDSVNLTTDQTVAGNKTFSFYTTLQDGQVNGAWHLFGTVGAFGATPVGRQTVTGSRGGNAALASLLTAMATLGWITDNTTA